MKKKASFISLLLSFIGGGLFVLGFFIDKGEKLYAEIKRRSDES